MTGTREKWTKKALIGVKKTYNLNDYFEVCLEFDEYFSRLEEWEKKKIKELIKGNNI